MKIRDGIDHILKLALLGAGIYVFVNWDFDKSRDDDDRDFAEQSCTDEIRDRFTVSTVRTYEVNATNNGYVVRASVTLPKGTAAKVYCLTNERGGVREIAIEEH